MVLAWGYAMVRHKLALVQSIVSSMSFLMTNSLTVVANAALTPGQLCCEWVTNAICCQLAMIAR